MIIQCNIANRITHSLDSIVDLILRYRNRCVIIQYRIGVHLHLSRNVNHGWSNTIIALDLDHLAGKATGGGGGFILLSSGNNNKNI